ncbi:acetate--CoA ligase family protein, partial [Candidatus Accumulibacter vicinus]|uniref:acetate--CoA ligase family protein n=1 Tax=Candidatus Accumulibacter vicinus TaxID=2954382 RepID=UPI00235B5C5A
MPEAPPGSLALANVDTYWQARGGQPVQAIDRKHVLLLVRRNVASTAIARQLASGAEFPEGAWGLRSPAEIRVAARDLRRRVRTQQPGSRVSAYRLRPGAARSGAPALRLGVADDPVFGSVIFLGPAST